MVTGLGIGIAPISAMCARETEVPEPRTTPARPVLYGEAVEVAVAVAVVEPVLSRVASGIVFPGGVLGIVRSVRSGNVAGVDGLSGRFNTNARAAPLMNGSTTATHISLSTKVVYLRP